ncbi:leucine-rich repeat flightless-interacting protein 2-like [Haliotis rubra]|uniref:leucine-rich repeat flightless-interacting protein 2-like n=1 Tax=Haliotis rubra TaxID=36100 RepID=UPI001EE5AA01|nr:leucine-rich repeat flightless-interacting protein 2-like [Haliotis rubra]
MSDRADRRRRSNIRQYSAEDQALNQISKEAETRLQAKRAARAEAREIRLKEIEKQQKEADEKHNRVHELITDHGKSRLSSSRRNSNDSNDSVESNRERDRDLKAELRELEEKYRQAMMTSATLDNEKQTLIYQLELLKDQIEEIEESYVELQREHKDRCRDLEMKKRSCTELESEVKVLREHMVLKDKLIEESGFVIMSTESGEYKLEKNSSMSNGPVPTTGSVLLSSESIEILKEAGDGSLDDKLKALAKTNKQYNDKIKMLESKVNEQSSKQKGGDDTKVPALNGPELQLYEVQRESSRQIHEYKFKLQKADQDLANLEGSVNRLESQVKRYKSDAERAEGMEDELKGEKRRLMRELREAQNQIEELTNQNKHLNKRMEKIKQTRSALGVQ